MFYKAIAYKIYYSKKICSRPSRITPPQQPQKVRINRWSSSESETDRKSRNSSFKPGGILKSDSFPPLPPELQSGNITSDFEELDHNLSNGISERRKRFVLKFKFRSKIIKLAWLSFCKIFSNLDKT